jgi:hypothetical protein
LLPTNPYASAVNYRKTGAIHLGGVGVKASADLPFATAKNMLKHELRRSSGMILAIGLIAALAVPAPL